MYNFKVDIIAGGANAAAYKFYRRQDYQYLHNSSVASMLREMQREVNMGRPFESRLHIDYNTNNHFSQLRSAGDLDCCFMAILLRRKPPGPRIMRNLWRNSRAQPRNNEKRNGGDSSYPRSIEVLLRGTAGKGYPVPSEVDKSHDCSSRK